MNPDPSTASSISVTIYNMDYYDYITLALYMITLSPWSCDLSPSCENVLVIVLTSGSRLMDILYFTSHLFQWSLKQTGPYCCQLGEIFLFQLVPPIKHVPYLEIEVNLKKVAIHSLVCNT